MFKGKKTLSQTVTHSGLPQGQKSQENQEKLEKAKKMTKVRKFNVF